VLVALVIAGCGRVSFDPLVVDASASTSDGSLDGSRAVTCTTEPFDTPDVQWSFWADAGFGTMFSSGQLRFSIPPNSDGYTGVDLVPLRDFTGGRVTVEVPEVAAGFNAEISVLLILDTANGYSISFSEGGIVFARRVNGVGDPAVIKGYNATSHRWWQIEHVAATDTIEMATSPDGTAWTIQKTAAAGGPMTALTLELVSGSYLGGNPTPGIPRFDNLTYCVR
jgi:hypothetical protein